MYRLLLVGFIASVLSDLSLTSNKDIQLPDHEASLQDNQTSRFCGAVKNLHYPKEKKYYLNIIAKVNWFQAMHLCHSMNMNFATVNHQKEYENMISTIKKANFGYPRFWLGGSDLGISGTYTWASTGNPVSYTHWASGEPSHLNHNGVVEHCIELFPTNAYYKMNDEPCNREKFAICEYWE